MTAEQAIEALAYVTFAADCLDLVDFPALTEAMTLHEQFCGVVNTGGTTEEWQYLRELVGMASDFHDAVMDVRMRHILKAGA